MTRTKPARRKNSKANNIPNAPTSENEITDEVNVNNTYEASKNTRIRLEELYDSHDDETMDGSQDENVYDDTDALKLQDIQNIVVGDIKQVRVTESSFTIVNESGNCYSSVQTPANDNENAIKREEIVGNFEKVIQNKISIPALESIPIEMFASEFSTATDGNNVTNDNHITNDSNPVKNENDVEIKVDLTAESVLRYQSSSEIPYSKSECENIVQSKIENTNCEPVDRLTEDTDRIQLADETIDDRLSELVSVQDDILDESDDESCEYQVVDEDFDISIEDDKPKSGDDEKVLGENSIECLPHNESNNSTDQYLSSCLDELNTAKSDTTSTSRISSPERINERSHQLNIAKPVVKEKVKDTFEDILKKIDDSTRIGAQRVVKLENKTANNHSKKWPKDTSEETAPTVQIRSDESIKSSNNKTEKKEKPEKKETRGRPRKNKEDVKPAATTTTQTKDRDREKEGKKERRRRSSRLKLKPDPKEEEKMLAKLLREAEKQQNNDNKEAESESKQTQDHSAEIAVNVAVEESAEMPPFQPIIENEYLTERSYSQDAKRMICDCTLSKEEIIRGEKGCGEDCLNRLLLIECCSRCALGDRCANKCFQKRQYAKCEAYKTQKKGFGLRVTEDIPSGTFIMEYVGEVIDADEFEERAMKYARDKISHFYFMALKSDYIIDATMKGNVSRFINHSCEPNAETQKWTVQGELRIGFFSKREISAGEEITFDYQLQRYGKQAQRCYCEAPSCTGWIGEDPDKQVEDDKRKDRRKKKHNEQYLDWEATLDEICQVGLINRHQTLSLNRLMVHAKELPVRMQILQVIEEGHPSCRRLFVDYHGLPIIWSWMVDCTPQQEELKIQLLKTLEALPITNKTILVDSKVYALVEQWAFVVDQKLQSEALSAQSVLESVEDIATAEETPVSELAQKVLNAWSSLREAYKIPRKERIQQMKEHEREADQNAVKPRPRKLPLYAERMRDTYYRNRYNKNKDFDKIYYDRLKDKKRKDSPDRGRDREHRKDGNKVSRMEHRYMFEMKVARENEERRRKWEGEEQNFWLQQSQNFYYNQQQHQIVSGQYMPQVTPSFTPDLNSITPAMIQNIQSLASSAQAHTQNYYGAGSTFMLAPSHLSASTPTGTATTTSILLSNQANAASPQTFYPNNVPLSSYVSNTTVPLPVPYPQMRTDCGDETVSYTSYDYQNVSGQPMTPTTSSTSTKTRCNENLISNDHQTSRNYDDSGLIATDMSVASNSSSSTSGVPQRCRLSKEEARKLLPPKWKIAFDSGNNMYFYHKETRQSVWYLPTEDTEQEEAEGSSEEESSQDEDDEDDEDQVDNRRKRKMEQSGGANYGKRNYKAESEMDAEIKENLAAMSSEFQDSDNEDYSPVIKNDDGSKRNSSDEPSANKSPPNNPLVTEHIISPREPIDKEERIRNKQRIRSRKEKLKRQKKHKKILAIDESSDGLNGIHANNSISSSNSSSLLSVPADTSSITDRRKKEAFRSTMANFVVHCLNPYFRSSCASARITNYNDFKHLARKLTHFVMVKELKHCRSSTDLNCNPSVKHKAKEFIRKYMSKFGEVYIRPPDDNKDYNSF